MILLKLTEVSTMNAFNPNSLGTITVRFLVLLRLFARSLYFAYYVPFEYHWCVCVCSVCEISQRRTRQFVVNTDVRCVTHSRAIMLNQNTSTNTMPHRDESLPAHRHYAQTPWQPLVYSTYNQTALLYKMDVFVCRWYPDVSRGSNDLNVHRLVQQFGQHRIRTTASVVLAE